MRSDGVAPRKAQPVQMVPPYAVCIGCGEAANAALVVVEGGAGRRIACLNCLDTRHVWRPCIVCARDLPSELHHVASRVCYPTFTTPLCLNCHRILYARQYRWRRDGSAERHPFRYLLIGVLDMVRLFVERSPAMDACRQFLTLLAHAAWLSLGALRLDGLTDVGHALAAQQWSF